MTLTGHTQEGQQLFTASLLVTVVFISLKYLKNISVN